MISRGAHNGVYAELLLEDSSFVCAAYESGQVERVAVRAVEEASENLSSNEAWEHQDYSSRFRRIRSTLTHQ